MAERTFRRLLNKEQQAAYELSTVNITFSNSSTNEPNKLQVESTYIYQII